MKKELIDRIIERLYDKYDHADLTKILEEELPDFQRINKERFREICMNSDSSFDSDVDKYNSTLPPALVPLPKDMPKYFFRQHSANDADDLWEWLLEHYGTPANNLQPLPDVDTLDEAIFNIWGKFMTDKQKIRGIASFISKTYGTPSPKPSLPSVEELAKEITVVFNQDSYDMMRSIAQHLHDKYSLHPREWWKDAIPYSTQFKYNDTVYTFSEYSYESSTQKTWIHNTGGGKILCSHCTPYTPPTAQEIIAKHNLSEEEVRAIREGKI